MDFSEDLAEIIGLLCAEGSYYYRKSSYLSYYKNRDKFYLRKDKETKYIQFANYDKNLLIHFKSLIKKVYDWDVSVEKDRVRICKRNIIKNLLNFTEYGHLKWKVPDFVLYGKKEIKTRFLRGFFDGEGTVSTTVRMFSTNKNSLLDVSKLLKDLNISYTFNGPVKPPFKKPYYYIYIRKKDENMFIKNLNPVSKIKTFIS